MAENFFNIETFKTNENFFLKKINAKMITLLHVFEHLEDPIRFLYKIKKNCLKKMAMCTLKCQIHFQIL